MRSNVGAEIMDKVHAPGHRRGEADTVIGAVNVVIHRLGYGHNREIFCVQAMGVTQGVIPTDGN